MNKSGSPKLPNKEKKEEEKVNEIKNQDSKISSSSFGCKNLLFPSGNDLNLMNFGSGNVKIYYFLLEMI